MDNNNLNLSKEEYEKIQRAEENAPSEETPVNETGTNQRREEVAQKNLTTDTPEEFIGDGVHREDTY